MSACPALMIAAPASGQGKTTLTAGLARLHRRMGRRVRVFKMGPDFLDPMILARASGAPVMSLDLWMVGEEACRQLLADAARDADLILIEGVMGLFDGTPSSADLAARFNVPVAAIVSAKAMAQTFGAVAFGLKHYRAGLPFHGVLANQVGSPGHARMLESALPDDIRWLGYVQPSDAMRLPARHLGLHQADEIAGLDACIDAAADALSQTALAGLPEPVEFGEATVAAASSASASSLPRLLDGLHIAVARDAAFSFIYPANLLLLDTLGARVSFFSPLADEAAPADADALYLPGGYPELHAATLDANTRAATSIRTHVQSGKTLVAECGGMLYLLESLTDKDGQRTPMLGLLPGHAQMQKRFAALGMQALDTPLGTMTGHTFHYSRLDTPLTPERHAMRPDAGAKRDLKQDARQDTRPAQGEPMFRHGPIVATYMHAYWPSNPTLTAALFHGQAF